MEVQPDPLPALEKISGSSPMVQFFSHSSATPSSQSYTHSQGSLLGSSIALLDHLPFFNQNTNLALISPMWSSPLPIVATLLPSIISGSMIRVPCTRFHTGTILHSLALYRSNTVFVSYPELVELLEDETIHELDFDRIENVIIGTLDGAGVGGYGAEEESMTSNEKQDIVKRISKAWKNVRNVVGVRGSLQAGLWGVESEVGQGWKVLEGKQVRNGSQGLEMKRDQGIVVTENGIKQQQQQQQQEESIGLGVQGTYQGGRVHVSNK